jgi:hypothetical protein
MDDTMRALQALRYSRYGSASTGVRSSLPAFGD